MVWTQPLRLGSKQNAEMGQVDHREKCYCSVAKLGLTLCDPMDCMQHSRLPMSFTITQSLLKLMSIESVMPSNFLILCRPLLLPSSIFPSIRVFSNESVLPIRWPKYWSFQLQRQSFQ